MLEQHKTLDELAEAVATALGIWTRPGSGGPSPCTGSSPPRRSGGPAADLAARAKQRMFPDVLGAR